MTCDPALVFLELVYWYFCITYAFGYKMKFYEAFCDMSKFTLILNTLFIVLIAPIDALFELFIRVKE